MKEWLLMDLLLLPDFCLPSSLKIWYYCCWMQCLNLWFPREGMGVTSISLAVLVKTGSNTVASLLSLLKKDCGILWMNFLYLGVHRIHVNTKWPAAAGQGEEDSKGRRLTKMVQFSSDFPFQNMRKMVNYFSLENSQMLCDRVWQLGEWSHFFIKNSYWTLLSLKRFDGTGHRGPQSEDLVFILRFTLYDGQNAAIRGLKLKLIFTFEATGQDNSRIWRNFIKIFFSKKTTTLKFPLSPQNVEIARLYFLTIAKKIISQQYKFRGLKHWPLWNL